jgi:hypothetical protein
MSVIVTVKFDVPATEIERVARDQHGETMLRIAEAGRQQGAMHHQFVEDADGRALVIDEWPDLDSFQRFFGGRDDIKQVMADAGVVTEPTVTVHRVLDMPDRF